MIIGSHVSFSNEQLFGSIKEALSYKANALMIYTGAPQNTVRSKIDENLTQAALNLMKENKIDQNNIICHAPYIVNLANHLDTDKHLFSVNFIIEEIKRCQQLGIKYLVLHPGSAVSMTKEEGLNNIISGLNAILNNDYNVMILIESMAGKGTESGTTIDELKYIFDNAKYPEKIGFCLDTCHLNDSGYDINNFDQYLDLFDKNIGIKKIKCIHVNDSKNPIGLKKDRHENIGFGTIGFNNLLNVIYNKRLENIPKILETPYVGNTDDSKERLYPPYKFEIEMIMNKKFDPSIKDKIRQYYQ